MMFDGTCPVFHRPPTRTRQEKQPERIGSNVSRPQAGRDLGIEDAILDLEATLACILRERTAELARTAKD